MDQTTKNMLMIFVAPVIVGLIIRFLVGKRKKGYLLSVVGALAACVVWLFVLLNGNGAEYYGLQAVMVSHFAGGSILVEVYFVLRYLFQRNKISRGQKGGRNEKVY